jgi:urease accessory protein
LAMTRIAWHLGNRHLLTEMLPKALRIRRDPVIEAMAAGLGARVIALEAPFNPEGGAYVKAEGVGAESQHQGHAHDHDHAQTHGHSVSGEHNHRQDHAHDPHDGGHPHHDHDHDHGACDHPDHQHDHGHRH